MGVRDVNEAFRALLDDCRKVARKRGHTDWFASMHAAISWGLEPQGASAYADDVVEIVTEAEPSLRVLVTRVENRNPVVCTNAAGLPLRWDGEVGCVKEHIRALVVAIDKTT